MSLREGQEASFRWRRAEGWLCLRRAESRLVGEGQEAGFVRQRAGGKLRRSGHRDRSRYRIGDTGTAREPAREPGSQETKRLLPQRR